MFAETFRSPVSKLLAFFRRSRDRWKAKCKQAKKELKSLKTCHAKLKASRDYWKQKARQIASVGNSPEPSEAGPTKSPAPASGVADARRRRNTFGAAAAGGR
jgi:tRNA/tmRNA/rRNA uracil-C5-methylase (TrmA/RlmC/RlmD family)